MSKVSSKLVAGVSKVKARQAATSATRKSVSSAAHDSQPAVGRAEQPANKALPVSRVSDMPPTPVWPD
jgi:hypothetical protein